MGEENLEVRIEKLLAEYTKADHINDKIVTLKLDFTELAFVYASVKGNNEMCKVMEETLIQACNAE